MASARIKQGLSVGGACSLSAIVVVLVLVSIPRLHDFALRENESDAAALVSLLAAGLEPGEDPGPSLQELASRSGLDARRDDIAWTDAGRLLRRHGYLFELLPTEDGTQLRAWPWRHGESGRAAFLFRIGEGLMRNANDEKRWSGLANPPGLDSPGWISLALSRPRPAAF